MLFMIIIRIGTILLNYLLEYNNIIYISYNYLSYNKTVNREL